MDRFLYLIATLLLVFFSFSSASDVGDPLVTPTPPNDTIVGSQLSDFTTGKPSPSEIRVFIAQTNDIHGYLLEENYEYENNRLTGGLDWLAGYLNIIKETESPFMLLDDGDQLQGTLISNYFEGETTIDIMNLMGYSAAIPGNHGFDFGPVGPESSYDPNNPNEDPVGALKARINQASFNFLGANIYEKNSLRPIDRNPDITPEETIVDEKIDWDRSRRVNWLKPYTIKRIRIAPTDYLRVAIIGLESGATDKGTNYLNVKHLYFRDPVKEYNYLYKKIKNDADVFIVLIHEGAQGRGPNSAASGAVVDFARGVTPNTLHAIIAGHVHSFTQQITKEIPIIQSWSNAKYFGLVSLVVNKNTKKINKEKTRMQAGIPVYHYGCKEVEMNPDFTDRNYNPLVVDAAARACEDDPEVRATFWEKEVEPDSKVKAELEVVKERIRPVAKRLLAQAGVELKRSRSDESNLGNMVADIAKEKLSSDVVIINSATFRDSIDMGPILYEELFGAIPFDNTVFNIVNVTPNAIVKSLKHHISSCGMWGGLQVSGLVVKYERNCSSGGSSGAAANSKLISVKTTSGAVLYENGMVSDEGTYTVSIIDFIYNGTSTYNTFKDFPVTGQEYVLRDLVDEYLTSHGENFVVEPVLDGRLENLLRDNSRRPVENNPRDPDDE